MPGHAVVLALVGAVVNFALTPDPEHEAQMFVSPAAPGYARYRPTACDGAARRLHPWAGRAAPHAGARSSCFVSPCSISPLYVHPVCAALSARGWEGIRSAISPISSPSRNQPSIAHSTDTILLSVRSCPLPESTRNTASAPPAEHVRDLLQRAGSCLPQRQKSRRGAAAEEHQHQPGGAQRGGSHRQLAFHRQGRRCQTPPSIS